MIASQVAIKEKLSHFIKDYTGDQYPLMELLHFLGRHPHTRFSRLAIVHALNYGKLYTERALRYLVNKEVIKVHIANNVPLYSLTKNEPLRSWALHLGRLEWSQWQLLFGERNLP